MVTTDPYSRLCLQCVFAAHIMAQGQFTTQTCLCHCLFQLEVCHHRENSWCTKIRGEINPPQERNDRGSSYDGLVDTDSVLQPKVQMVSLSQPS